MGDHEHSFVHAYLMCVCMWREREGGGEGGREREDRGVISKMIIQVASEVSS